MKENKKEKTKKEKTKKKGEKKEKTRKKRKNNARASPTSGRLERCRPLVGPRPKLFLSSDCLLFF